MKTRQNGVRLFAVAGAILTAVAVPMAYPADIFVGTGFGLSLSVPDRSDRRTILPFPSYRLKWGTISLIGVVLPGHASFFAEVMVQGYRRVVYPEPSSNEVILGFGGSVELRLFEDMRKTFNPYFQMGMGFLSGTGGGSTSSRKDYPPTASARIAVGARVRVAKALYFDPSVSFISGSQSLLFRARLWSYRSTHPLAEC